MIDDWERRPHWATPTGRRRIVDGRPQDEYDTAIMCYRGRETRLIKLLVWREVPGTNNEETD